MSAALLKLGFAKSANRALTIGLALIILVAVGIGFHQQIKNQLNAWKLLPEPERLTELYFTHPNSLPAKYVPDQTQTVSFVVHNLEYRTTTYHYQIIESSQTTSQTKQLAASSFTLRQNQYKTITRNLPVADAGPHVKVSVNLTNVNEHIDYLINRSGT